MEIAIVQIMKRKNTLKLILFLILMGILLFVTNFVLAQKEAKKNMYALRYEKADTIDIIFCGNSHANNAFYPMELWGQYGYTAYSYSQMSQTLPLVYYSIEDAISLQHPQLVVVDLFAITSYDIMDSDLMHLTIDNLTLPTRLRAIKEYLPRDKWAEYAIPLYLYHDRWSEIDAKDFIPYMLRYSPKRNPRKGATLVADCQKCEYPQKAVQCALSGERAELSEMTLYWYEKIKDLCDRNGVAVMFVVVPYECAIGGSEESVVENMRLFNATEDWCASNGVNYLNLFRELDTMEFDFDTDMQDVSHVNVLGAVKVTKSVGEYINKNYAINDRREDAELSNVWNEFYGLWMSDKEMTVNQCRSNYELFSQ